MHKATNALIRSTLATAAIAGIIAGSLALPSLAAADVTGYQTGYSYHEGLANGDGGLLMAQGDSSAADNAATTNTTGPSVSSDGTSVSTIPQAPIVAQEVAPAPEAAAVQPAATAAAPSFLASLSPVVWAAIALVVIAILIALLTLSYQPRRTTTVTRSYQRYS